VVGLAATASWAVADAVTVNPAADEVATRAGLAVVGVHSVEATATLRAVTAGPVDEGATAGPMRGPAGLVSGATAVVADLSNVLMEMAMAVAADLVVANSAVAVVDCFLPGLAQTPHGE
jgi:hypothetical protein